MLWNFNLFLHALFQFGLTIAPIQNTGLINAKYNNTLSGKYNNTLYGTINTNRLNIFTLILRIFKILKKHMVDSNKNKNLICETNLTNVGFANSAPTMIWCAVFDFKLVLVFDFKYSVIQRTLYSQGPYSTILFLGLLWIQYRRKLYVRFWLVDGHQFLVHGQDFQKIEKFIHCCPRDALYRFQ